MKNYKAFQWSLLILLFTFSHFSVLAQPEKKTSGDAGKVNPWNINPYSKKQYNVQDAKNIPAKEKEVIKEKIKENAKKNNINSNNNNSNNNGNNNNDATDVGDEANEEIVNQKETNGTGTSGMDQQQMKIYGMSFFSGTNFSLTDNAVVTPPSSYRIGSGDELIVNIWGPSEQQLNFEVGRDGAIYSSWIGKINVGGLSFASAKQIISNKLRKIISAGSNIDVQLGRARTIKVVVMGEVKRPGTITLGAFNTALNAIGMAGGPTALANLREIQIKRNGSVVNTIDMYEFIRSGGSLDDVYMDDGDVINIGVYDKLVSAVGSFKRPMNYILKKEETLDDLLSYAGGPSFDARYSNIQVRTIVDEEPRLITVNMNLYEESGKTLLLFDGDEVNINKVNNNFSNTIELIGAVKYPDVYQVVNGEKLLDVLRKAGGLESDAYTSRAYIYRGDEATTDAFEINLNGLETESPKNIEILPGDRVSIISKREFQNSYAIDIIGAVRKPGPQKFLKGIKLKDALILAGGLNTEAENGRIEIVSISDSATEIELSLKPNPNSKIITINPNLEIDQSSENIYLQPYDKIYIRKKSEFSLTKTITIEGEVRYPGEYALLADNETISSVIARAGGLTEAAFVGGTSFLRTEISDLEKKTLLSQSRNILTQSTDINDASARDILEKNAEINKAEVEIIINLASALEHPKEDDDLTLKNGDKIKIPTKNENVSIVGAVQNPSTFKYNSNLQFVEDLVDASGGFSQKALKRKITVRYSNGVTRRTRNFGIYRIYPKLEPGAVVLVPMKAEKVEKDNKRTENVAVMAGLITTFSTMFLTINSLLKQ